ncbi:MAG: acetyl-CoA carboxylase, carboxyltransferase subunit beta [Acholeplasmatales bacterium]|nr:acetyl-CoA carboxylase, carboxyltransferase subunit beta [Acholeplasmatales bacterium]
MQDSFDKRKEELAEFNTVLEQLNVKAKAEEQKKTIPDDLMVQCKFCSHLIIKEDLLKNLSVCPYCNNHFRLKPKQRLDLLMDKGYELIFENMKEKHIDFPEYKEKFDAAKIQGESDESIVCAKGKIDGISALVGVMNSFFMMGSMGSVTGERVTKLVELSNKEHLPLIIFTCSGGARMQEGIYSLFQLTKTTQVLQRNKELYISYITDPTTGGVSASFAMLGDINLAEPNALIGFAGKRVIENTIKETLPPEFQKSEFVLDKGFIDKIVERKDMKTTISQILRLHNYK